MPDQGPGNTGAGGGGGGNVLPVDWAQQVLQTAGITPNAANVELLYLVANGEHGTPASQWGQVNSGGAFNPFDSTLHLAGATAYNQNNGYPVWNYPNWETGLQAAVELVKQDPNVFRALQGSNLDAMKSAWDSAAFGGTNLNTGNVTNPANGQPTQPYAGMNQGATGQPITTPPGGQTGGPILSIQQEQADLNKIAAAGGIKAIDISYIPKNLLQSIAPEIEKYLNNPALQKAIEERIVSDYGYSAWILTDPQVAGALVAGAIGNWDANTFVGVLTQTKWYQTHNENQRNWLEIVGTDPATAKELLFQAQDKILATSKALGVQLTAAQLSQMSYTVASNSATKTGVITNRLGFTQEQIDAMVAGAYHYNTRAPQTGDAAQLFDAFQKMAAEYLLPMGNNALGQHVQNAIHNFSGQGDFIGGSAATFENYLKQQAVSLYPTMKAALDAGMTPYQWTDPYRQMAGSVLEKNPNSINLTDPLYRWMIDQPGPNGQRQVSSIADAQTKLMNDPRFGYQYTQQARNMAYELVDKLGQTFGKIGGGM